MMAGGEHHMIMFIVGFAHDTVLQQVRLPTSDTSFDKHFTNATMSVRCEQDDNKTCPVCSKDKYVFEESVLVTNRLFVLDGLSTYT